MGRGIGGKDADCKIVFVAYSVKNQDAITLLLIFNSKVITFIPFSYATSPF